MWAELWTCLLCPPPTKTVSFDGLFPLLQLSLHVSTVTMCLTGDAFQSSSEFDLDVAEEGENVSRLTVEPSL